MTTPTKDTQDTTVGEMLEMASQHDAGVMKVVARNTDGSIRGAVIVTNADSTEEVLAAIEEIEDGWADDDDEEDGVPPYASDADRHPEPVPVRLIGKYDLGDRVLGDVIIDSIDASIVFGASEHLALTMTPDQAKKMIQLLSTML